MPTSRRLVLALALLALGRAPLAAQSLGSFTWQLQPFCNRVTVTVTQQGATYTLDGFDDQCGAPQRAPLVGLATPNPDGSIGLGFHVVTVPGGRTLSIDARISLATVSGTWADSAGNSGTFAFNGATGGSPRPQPTIPAAALAPGSITAAQLAPGLIGTVAQARVIGVCANGQALRGVNPDGTVACTDLDTVADANGQALGSDLAVAIGFDGLPFITHLNATVNTLRVTHCGNATCSAGNESTDIASAGIGAGRFTSIAIGADHLPVIAHYESGVADLRVTHCGDAACKFGTVTTVVDGASMAVGQFTSIAIGTDGLPIIAYLDSTNLALRVTHCGNVACTAGNVSNSIDNPADMVGITPSIAIGTDGLPVIGHQNGTKGGLRVTHCGNVTCTAGNVSTDVDDPANITGWDISLAIGSDGLPVISHQDHTAGTLRLTHCGNVSCTAGSVSTTVDASTSAVGSLSSLAIGHDGLPIVSHTDTASGGVRVTHCGNVTCTAGTVSRIVFNPTASSLGNPAMAIGVDGLPVIAGRQGSGVTVVKCGVATCQ